VTVGSLAALVVAALIWTFAASQTFVIPSPVETFRILFRDIADPNLTDDFTLTAVEIGTSILIGTAIGTIVGVIMGMSTLVRTVLQSLISALYALPKIVLYPLLIPVLGIGAGSKVAVGVIFCVFPIVLIVAAATASMPPVYRKLATSLQVKPHQFLTKVVLPITLRALVTGVRVGLSLAVLGVILAEFVASQRGIGRQMHRYYELAQYDGLFATVLALLLITFVASWALWRVEKAFEWQ
jgi:NitT/TauT family transport system permease protein